MNIINYIKSKLFFFSKVKSFRSKDEDEFDKKFKFILDNKIDTEECYNMVKDYYSHYLQ